ncbi:hypothetical protein, partial [Micromonospora sp. NPDC023814]|uniref:hypothetical protein n=1 Tax=Micromonospora sp. NPDC023814 TaxID=3154596 RepID=UPI0033EF8C04
MKPEDFRDLMRKLSRGCHSRPGGSRWSATDNDLLARGNARLPPPLLSGVRMADTTSGAAPSYANSSLDLPHDGGATRASTFRQHQFSRGDWSGARRRVGLTWGVRVGSWLGVRNAVDRG